MLTADRPDPPPHLAHWPRRLPRELIVPETTLWFNLEVSAARYPDKPAFLFFGQALSYRLLKERAQALAGWLEAQGVQRGDRVAIFLQNCPQFIIAFYAVMRLGAVVVPVNPMNRAEELKHYITDPDARVAITTADLAGEIAAASNALPAGQRLAHLIVSHYTDAFDADVQGDDAPPAPWRDWLLTRHALPTLDGG
ncbi:MAG: AMP-binding protein, partial [Burkholderiales bacterium]|nr:AMP-binding protein [Burkholderiales bacterium]